MLTKINSVGKELTRISQECEFKFSWQRDDIFSGLSIHIFVSARWAL